VGTAGSANIGDEYAMFEAIHGSAPRLIEEGRGMFANPTSIFRACEMLLRHIGFTEYANKLNRALNICTETEKKVVIDDTDKSATCAEFADYLMETIKVL
ncbi:MAG: isocitrate/isopropylmalate family dehydrogenase, partial [Oscillospiraceae bacterium]|nr:isocitrate/isopropylmalate family dehydrogenase [Oscillospiraceae bacterium]